jgi:hypothetical protein
MISTAINFSLKKKMEQEKYSAKLFDFHRKSGIVLYMGFFKDFENEIKILFVLIALVILVGWFGAVSSLSVLQGVARQEAPQESGLRAAPEESDPQGMAEEEAAQETGPAQYSSEAVGVSFEYPAEWFLYDETVWEQDNAAAACGAKGTIENTVILSRSNLGRCVGVQEFNAWPGDVLVSFSEKEWKDFPFILSSEKSVEIGEIGGVSAARYLFKENSLDTRKQAVRVYANVQERGYIIEFTQTDTEGNYDPIFDEILASVQWL